MKAIDLSGQKFNMLTAITMLPPKGPSRCVRYLCKCDCGSETIVPSSPLRSGATKSCGCLARKVRGDMNRTHGGAGATEYSAWLEMKKRCLNSKSKTFLYYGGRGIKVCAQWVNDFAQFLRDVGKKPTPQHSLDRINPNGDYEPHNCRWATKTEQSRNTRKHNQAKNGAPGILWRPHASNYEVRIIANGVHFYLGVFDNLFDACCARRSAENRYEEYEQMAAGYPFKYFNQKRYDEMVRANGL